MRRDVALKSLVGVMAGALLVGCPGDDGGGDGTESAATGTGTQTGGTTPGTNSNSNTNPTDGMTGTSMGPATDPTSATTAVDTTAGATDDTTGGNPNVPPCPYDEVAGSPAPGLELVATGCTRPVQAVGHPTQPDRLYVVEQTGTVKIVEPGSGTCGATFMTVPTVNVDPNTVGSEAGLLGFAFHPNFPTDGRVYVNYTPQGGGTIVEEYTVDAGNPDQVDPSTARTVIEFCQPAGNHNGGQLLFDEAGMLLITTGDGGPQDDALGNGQNNSQVLGKILRVDVEPDGNSHDVTANNCGTISGQTGYGIPADNPFVGNGAVIDEIYATGFRNPWRAAFDPMTGDLFVGDVGQGSWEEVTIAPPGSNHGWGDMEGLHCNNDPGCDITAPGTVNGDGYTMPVTDYSHGGGACSITGFAVYRSCEVPGWGGLFFYADYCSRVMGAVNADVSFDQNNLLNIGEAPLGNGYNAWGDVFVTTVQTSAGIVQDGKVYRIAPGA